MGKYEEILKATADLAEIFQRQNYEIEVLERMVDRLIARICELNKKIEELTNAGVKK